MARKRTEAEAAEQTEEQPAPEPAKPHRVIAPHAYYTDDGSLMSWADGQVITDPAEIAHLKRRGARMTEI